MIVITLSLCLFVWWIIFLTELRKPGGQAVFSYAIAFARLAIAFKRLMPIIKNTTKQFERLNNAFIEAELNEILRGHPRR